MHTFSLYLLRHLKHESMIFRIKKCIRLRLGPDHGESHFFKGYFAKLASSWKILRILRVKRHSGEVLWFSGRAVRPPNQEVYLSGGFLSPHEWGMRNNKREWHFIASR